MTDRPFPSLRPRLHLPFLPLLTGGAQFLITLAGTLCLIAHLLLGAWQAESASSLLIAFPKVGTAPEKIQDRTPAPSPAPEKPARKISSAHARARSHTIKNTHQPVPLPPASPAPPPWNEEQVLQKLSSFPGGKQAAFLPPEQIRALFRSWGAPWEGPMPPVLALPLQPGQDAASLTPLAHLLRLSFPEALVILPPPQSSMLPKVLAPLWRHTDLLGFTTAFLALCTGLCGIVQAARLAVLQTARARRLLTEFGAFPRAGNLGFRVALRAMAGAFTGGLVALACSSSQWKALSPFWNSLLGSSHTAFGASSGTGIARIPPDPLKAFWLSGSLTVLVGILFFGLIAWLATRLFLLRAARRSVPILQ
ncbi:hypothetical protein [Oecophyllibacter saccharovorans]|uniref:Uncharacterized protein n=1 Tax=Oecophyllibacter saccharovorans TaxID=2558360 RepID=A0A506URH1_9PROT|nr:hypothetical protein [Oecophyllibacter saccharovorans]TPW35879.1 hypothetical protein E3202_02845 [Oecophyllibacter saccharovorans]